MMKMGMRPQKKQAGPTSLRWTSGTAKFVKRPYSAVGFKNFEVMVVGAAGGRSGRAGDTTNGVVHPAGGGGGQSVRVSGLLADLPVESTVTVGAKGANGGDSGNMDGLAGNGKTGGSSNFNDVATAVGGSGGKGGFVSVSPPYTYVRVASEGGRGGGNPADGAGVWNDTTKIGRGGQGGSGRITNGTINIGANVDPTNGTNGAQTGADNAYRSYGEQATNNIGGTGGGVNIAPFTGGAEEIFGGGRGTHDGVVLLKIS